MTTQTQKKLSLLAKDITRFNRKAIRANPRFLAGWFTGYSLLFALLLWFIIMYRYVLPLTDQLPRLITSLINLYPPDLIITIHNGQASSNQPEPYAIPFSAIEPVVTLLPFEISLPTAINQKQLVVIDTAATTAQYATYHTYALLTQTAFLYQTASNRVDLVPLSQIPDIVLDRESVSYLAQTLTPQMIRLPYVFAFVSLLLLLFGIPLLFALVLMLLSFWIWMMLRLLSRKLRYQGVLSLSALYAALIVVVVALFLFVPFLSLPLLAIMGIYSLSLFAAALTASTN
jgi:hypothetical protein